jgi:hypothetical protein
VERAGQKVPENERPQASLPLAETCVALRHDEQGRMRSL